MPSSTCGAGAGVPGPSVPAPSRTHASPGSPACPSTLQAREPPHVALSLHAWRPPAGVGGEGGVPSNSPWQRPPPGPREAQPSAPAGQPRPGSWTVGDRWPPRIAPHPWAGCWQRPAAPSPAGWCWIAGGRRRSPLGLCGKLMRQRPPHRRRPCRGRCCQQRCLRRCWQRCRRHCCYSCCACDCCCCCRRRCCCQQPHCPLAPPAAHPRRWHWHLPGCRPHPLHPLSRRRPTDCVPPPRHPHPHFRSPGRLAAALAERLRRAICGRWPAPAAPPACLA